MAKCVSFPFNFSINSLTRFRYIEIKEEMRKKGEAISGHCLARLSDNWNNKKRSAFDSFMARSHAKLMLQHANEPWKSMNRN